MVLSCQVQDPSFSDAILTNPSLELISKLGGQCDPGLRLPVVEMHCQQLRKLFKDFVKPAELPKKVAKSGKKMVLDGSRAFPPVRGCVFTEGYTCVHFMADPAAGFGLPRGTFVYASSPLPQRVSYRGGDIFFFNNIQKSSPCFLSRHTYLTFYPCFGNNSGTYISHKLYLL